MQNADMGLEWIISGGQLGIEQWALEEAVSFTKRICRRQDRIDVSLYRIFQKLARR